MGDVVSINIQKMREPKICTHIHCAMCCEEVPAGESMQDYNWREIGFTDKGIQVWCLRHNCNILHLDFDGQKMAAVEG
ncbi:MAG: hypothetical protein V3S54_01995 [Woeseiaceae bacterium]